MAFLSGLFFPLPPSLKTFQPVWPTFHLAQLALGAAGLPSRGSVLTHVLVLAATTAVLTALAARRLARRG
jgi:ABC-2 type transport system permease protein